MNRRAVGLVMAAALWLSGCSMIDAYTFFPERSIGPPPPGVEESWITTEDGQRLHAWYAGGPDPAPTLIWSHGNAGNIGGRADILLALARRGLRVLAFDYRGYGRSSGRPSERGTYLDARAARDALRSRESIDGARVLYLGESLGGAVALALALELPPAGVILQSTFTSVRDMARVHYPLLPPALVPDAYPSLRLIRRLQSPLLVLHGARDEIVPLMHAEALVEAAPEPKRMHVFPGVGHNDLLTRAGRAWGRRIEAWARDLPQPGTAG